MGVWNTDIPGPSATITTWGPESVGVEARQFNGTSGASGAWVSANFAMFVPVLIYSPVTIVKIAVGIGSFTGGNLDVGIYDESQRRLVSSGSTACGSTSSCQAVDIADTYLTPGLYYAALVCDGNVVNIMRASPSNVGSRAIGLYQQASAFPLPDPATFAVSATASPQALVPLIALQQRTTP